MIDYEAFARELAKIAQEAEAAPAEPEEFRSTRGRRGAAMAAGGIGGALLGGKVFLDSKDPTKRYKGQIKVEGPNQTNLHKLVADDKSLYDKVLKQGPQGVPVENVSHIRDNAHFDPSKGKSGIIRMGTGTQGYAPTLAHEMGHADLHKSRLGRVLQNKGTMIAGALGSNPIVGALSGGLTAQSDNETVRRLGRWAPAIAAAPMLGYEAGASILGYRRLRRAGASKQQLRNAMKNFTGAWGTYGGGAALGTGAAHGVQALATSEDKLTPEQRAKVQQIKAQQAAEAGA